ncbi:MAG: hypothetical protein LLG45_06785, partial [Actinomycetia bacterium]|nr:hypothetical protein [Actinomycetes bacterium]
MNDPSHSARPVPGTAQAQATSEGRAGAAVFFDLDGTLVVGQTTLLLVGFLSKAGVVGRAFVLGTGLW